jgi:hypothetical protein
MRGTIRRQLNFNPKNLVRGANRRRVMKIFGKLHQLYRDKLWPVMDQCQQRSQNRGIAIEKKGGLEITSWSWPKYYLVVQSLSSLIGIVNSGGLVSYRYQYRSLN